MREGTRGLRHTIRHEDGRMLLSCNRKSLGAEGCLPTERTNAADTAFALIATCKIAISTVQLLTRKKGLQTPRDSLP